VTKTDVSPKFIGQRIEEKKLTPLTDRILYATDLSSDSIGVLRYAVNYANQHKIKLIVFHVINQQLIIRSKIAATFLNEGPEYKIRHENSAAALKRMENLVKIVCKENPQNHREDIKNVEHLVIHYGRIADEIVEKADRWGCELIFLGPRRKRFLGRIFLPSVARSVIRRTDKPVHIIKLQK